MAGSHTQLEPYRPLKAQKGKRPPRAPLAPRAPGPEEEDPRVKCRDCGAFGHKASSSRCPMKHWGRALDLQALGSRKLKENVEPRSQQDQENPGPLKQAERKKGEGPRQEAWQREALLQRFPRRPQGGQKQTWKDCTESCSYVRKSEGFFGHVPVSVLHEDLQVSSSSEDSGRE
ncbi:protein FAM90A1 [Enhydra lutris kenyoni]|uniref:Protein FAM90A1 n=1 Tax=Enhydra lutris kenyoni TaxID=391180 RepID=A0A2Y9J1G9_ENHLU|nr:protein FAM90A1 [Enhydra lutris kenyoni]